MRRRIGTSIVGVVALAAASLASVVLVAGPAAAVDVNDEASFRTAFANDAVVNLTADITLATACDGTSQAAIRNSSDPVVVEGNGFTITQTCDDDSVLVQDGTGLVTLRNVELDAALNGVASDGPVALAGSTVRGRFYNGDPVGVVANGGASLTDSLVTGISGSGNTVGVQSDGTIILTRSEIRDLADDDGDVYGVLGENITLVDSVISGLDGADGASAVFAIGEADITTSQITDLTGYSGVLGIYGIAGTTTLTDSVVSGLRATNGGVIAVYGSEGLSVVRSTIADVTGSDGSIGAVSQTTTIVNSTITRVNGYGVNARTLTIAYSDIVGNGNAEFNIESLELRGTDVMAELDVRPVEVASQIRAETLILFGSVVTDAVGVDNCDVETVTSQGYNFADDTSCGLTSTGDTQASGADPLLGPLADNGGPTPTFLPQAASPLLEAIPAAACQTGVAAGITTDQRSEPRPGFTSCDIGSVELQPVVIEPNFTG